MSRSAAAAAVCALLLSAAAPALADGKAPDAAQVRQAAEQFDSGITAFKQKDFEGAAARFEAADAAVPSPQALRQAIRARMEAGQGSRAATLAAQALERYPSDEGTARLANETISKVAPLVQKVRVACLSPCLLALGTRSVPGEANTRWTVYLDPGKITLGASFFGGAGSVEREIDAKAGTSSDLRFEPEEKKQPSRVTPPTKTPPVDTPPAETPPTDTPPDGPTPEAPPKPSGIHPAVFITGLVATAGLGGATVWSGLDTKNNPGVDAVRTACAGKGETCDLYQQGRSRQLRTNILIGATAGTAAVTVVLAIFTRWHGPRPRAQRPRPPSPTAAR